MGCCLFVSGLSCCHGVCKVFHSTPILGDHRIYAGFQIQSEVLVLGSLAGYQFRVPGRFGHGIRMLKPTTDIMCS